MIESIIECARAAGEHALTYFRHKQRMSVENKLNDSDIVTTADKECEAMIRAFIAQRFPDHSILGEEAGEREGSSGYRWVIDPIDGTTNFYSGIPLWGVSIGVEHNGATEYGVVYLPATGELFHAVRGAGAFLNGRPIAVSQDERLSRAVVSTGFPVDKDTNPDNNLDNLAAVLPHVRDIRRLGAASADLCYVAAGFLGGYWEMNLHEWDVCAGTLIVTEAGGKCSRFRADRGVAVVCGNAAVHDALKALLSTEPRRG